MTPSYFVGNPLPLPISEWPQLVSSRLFLESFSQFLSELLCRYRTPSCVNSVHLGFLTIPFILIKIGNFTRKDLGLEFLCDLKNCFWTCDFSPFLNLNGVKSGFKIQTWIGFILSIFTLYHHSFNNPFWTFIINVMTMKIAVFWGGRQQL